MEKRVMNSNVPDFQLHIYMAILIYTIHFSLNLKVKTYSQYL